MEATGAVSPVCSQHRQSAPRGVERTPRQPSQDRRRALSGARAIPRLRDGPRRPARHCRSGRRPSASAVGRQTCAFGRRSESLPSGHETTAARPSQQPGVPAIRDPASTIEQKSMRIGRFRPPPPPPQRQARWRHRPELHHPHDATHCGRGQTACDLHCQRGRCRRRLTHARPRSPARNRRVARVREPANTLRLLRPTAKHQHS